MWVRVAASVAPFEPRGLPSFADVQYDAAAGTAIARLTASDSPPDTTPNDIEYITIRDVPTPVVVRLTAVELAAWYRALDARYTSSFRPVPI